MSTLRAVCLASVAIGVSACNIGSHLPSQLRRSLGRMATAIESPAKKENAGDRQMPTARGDRAEDEETTLLDPLEPAEPGTAPIAVEPTEGTSDSARSPNLVRADLLLTVAEQRQETSDSAHSGERDSARTLEDHSPVNVEERIPSVESISSAGDALPPASQVQPHDGTAVDGAPAEESGHSGPEGSGSELEATDHPDPDGHTPIGNRDIESIISRARSGVGYSYHWGESSWRADGTNKGTCKDRKEDEIHGADCSGYLAKVWQVPRPSELEEEFHPYTSSAFSADSEDWKIVDTGAEPLRRGDAIWVPGHVIMFDELLPKGQVMAFESANCKTGIVHRARSIGPKYRVARLRALAE